MSGRSLAALTAVSSWLTAVATATAQQPPTPAEPSGTTAGAIVAGPPTAGGQAGLGILAGRPSVRPTRVDDAPRIDGRLDDEAWRKAVKLTQFVQQRPLDGAPATEPTDVYLAYDGQMLYIGFHVHYADPSIMRANRVDRDRAAQDDLMTVYFDTFLDQQRAYSFDVNAYGVQGDGIVNQSRTGGGGDGGAIPFPDRSWDALFYTGAEIVADGYTAEMAIPFKSLRYPRRGDDVPHRWGFQIVREIKSKDEENDVWAPMSRGTSSFLGQMGVIEGMTQLSTSRNLELLPTFTAIHFGSRQSSTGAYVDDGTTPEAGLNVKYGITSNLIADFTVNPDFSQIESDQPQIDVNLRFPLFFPELRPFFVEGQEIFNIFSPINIVHTRTIVDPRYGAKLTGKVRRMTVGLLVTDDPAPGRRDDPDDRLEGETAQFLVGRARYDLYSESHIGFLTTDREFGDTYSRVAGFDGQFRLSRAARLNFIAFQSYHRDEAGVERSGLAWGTFLQHNGRNLRVTNFTGMTDPEFRTDAGFVRRVDQKTNRTNVSYRWWPQSWVVNWGPQANYERSYNFAGELEDEIAGGGLNVTFARNIGGSAQATRALERFAGLDFWKWTRSADVTVNTSRRFAVGGKVSWGDQVFYDPVRPFLGEGLLTGFNVTLRPISQLQTRINLDWSRFTDPTRGNAEVFDVKILRGFTTYQFTDRLLVRNIAEYNTFRGTLGVNLLATYRVNAGTVFFAGYDDHYRQGDRINPQVFPGSELQRTNRAIFTKLQYLFRH